MIGARDSVNTVACVVYSTARKGFVCNSRRRITVCLVIWVSSAPGLKHRPIEYGIKSVPQAIFFLGNWLEFMKSFANLITCQIDVI
jgi:hypothetical protein